MQIIKKLDKEKLGCYKDKIITDQVVLTDERLYQHILVCHGSDYRDLKPYIKDIIKYPDFIIVDNKH